MARDPLERPEEAIRRLYAYVAYRIGPGPDAEDVVSETIERALRYRDSYDPRKGPPIGWLIGIAGNCLSDHARAGAGRVDADPETLLEAEDDFAGRLAAGADVRAAVSTLDDRERELIALRYGADLKAKDIGRVLDMRTNAVEVALHRALARLRAQLEQPGSDSEPRVAPAGATDP